MKCPLLKENCIACSCMWYIAENEKCAIWLLAISKAYED